MIINKKIFNLRDYIFDNNMANSIIKQNHYNLTKKNHISNSWFFRISSLAFVTYFTSFIAVTYRGLIGFLILICLAFFIGILEKSFPYVLNKLKHGISQNKLLFILALWYVIGFIMNTLFRGRGLHDWRLMITPFIFILSLLFSFGFMTHKINQEKFLHVMIIFFGCQAVITVPVLITSENIARVAWLETYGAWIYGNQLVYAIYAICLPLFFYFSFMRKGILRVLLLLCSIFILIECMISSFATPLGLIGLSVILISGFSLIALLKTKKKTLTILIIGLLILLGFFGYRLSNGNPLFSSSYDRIINFLIDPVSGGYSQYSGGVSRWKLAEISINSFFQEPIWGIGGPSDINSKIGGHSSFFDSLGLYGILGGGYVD